MKPLQFRITLLVSLGSGIVGIVKTALDITNTIVCRSQVQIVQGALNVFSVHNGIFDFAFRIPQHMA